MSSTLASILVNISTSAGASATDYTAPSGVCPILGFNCIGSSGSGDVKITPYSAANCSISSLTGSGARLRVATDASGTITAVEIAAGGTAYPTGTYNVVVNDVYGSGASITCGATGGAIATTTIVAGGTGYSGYILMDVSDFIEGVTYNIVPRFIEKTSGAGTLRLMGYKLPYRPYQVF